jgi:iron only hydrogenase large subunit-like protein
MGESVICLHPPIEERGRVKADDDLVFRVSLKDCLACSGCAITEDEVSLLGHQDPSRIISTIAEKPGFAVLLSTIAIANLSAHRCWPIDATFASISEFFRSRGAAVVTTDAVWQTVWRLLLLETLPRVPRPMIVSRCPAAVLFFERKTIYARHLASIKPFSQLFAKWMRAKNPTIPYFVNVAPCFDRKLETGRFGDIDAVLTIGEIAAHLSQREGEFSERFPPATDAAWLLKKLAGGGEMTTIESGRTIEYRIGDLSAASIYGEAALRRFCANLDRGQCRFEVVEADFCPAACASGGGLVRGESPAARQQLVRDTLRVHQACEGEEGGGEQVEQILAELREMDIAVEYKSVEQPAPETDFTF